MAVRPITTLGHQILRTKALPVDDQTLASKKFKTLITDLVDSMQAARGIGIAAPQIGVSLQVAIINARDGALVIVNPRITKTSFRTTSAEEGCLSVPGVFGLVRRPTTITITYTDEHGKSVRIEASGLLARVFQHEVDHLNGILFIDKVARLTQGVLS